MDFEWDEAKAESNERKHGVSFSEAMTVMATSPEHTGPVDDELRSEYEFRSLRGVVRGKYAAQYRERLRVVRLADDVAAAFRDEAAVNDALREYLRGRSAERSRA